MEIMPFEWGYVAVNSKRCKTFEEAGTVICKANKGESNKLVKGENDRIDEYDVSNGIKPLR